MNYYYYIIAALILNMFIFDKIPLLRYILTPIAGLTLAIISAPLGFAWMTLFVWFIKKDKEPSLGSYPTDLRIKYNCIIRGDLPKLLRWGQPVDDRFPGPMYEPLIEKIYLKYVNRQKLERRKRGKLRKFSCLKRTCLRHLRNSIRSMSRKRNLNHPANHQS